MKFLNWVERTQKSSIYIVTVFPCSNAFLARHDIHRINFINWTPFNMLLLSKDLSTQCTSSVQTLFFQLHTFCVRCVRQTLPVKNKIRTFFAFVLIPFCSIKSNIWYSNQFRACKLFQTTCKLKNHIFSVATAYFFFAWIYRLLKMETFN